MIRKRFKVGAICRAEGNSEMYKVTNEAHKEHLKRTREARMEVIDKLITTAKEITCAKDLIGRTTLIFNKRILITASDAVHYWNAFGSNIKLV